jgi:hypothetical protein
MKTLVVDGVIALALFARATLAQEITLNADSAVLSGPFVLTNGCLCQARITSLTNGGRGLFSFNITNAGGYAVQIIVNAQSPQPHSFGVNIDGEPKEPEMIWDIGATSGFEPHIVSWRGNGTAISPQFSQQVFNLSAGAHQLIVRGKDPNTQLQRISILPLPPAPTGLHVVSGP